jgi:hypothetical protein
MQANAVIRALRHVWLTLEPLKRPMAVLGGLAMARWKCLRATRDVDLLLSAGEREPSQLIETLRAAQIRPKRDPPLTTVGRLDLIQLLHEPPGSFVDLQIDLFLAGSDYHRAALERRVPTELPHLDVHISVLACEDLILHKLIAGPLIDRADAPDSCAPIAAPSISTTSAIGWTAWDLPRPSAKCGTTRFRASRHERANDQ